MASHSVLPEYMFSYRLLADADFIGRFKDSAEMKTMFERAALLLSPRLGDWKARSCEDCKRTRSPDHEDKDDAKALLVTFGAHALWVKRSLPPCAHGIPAMARRNIIADTGKSSRTTVARRGTTVRAWTNHDAPGRRIVCTLRKAWAFLWRLNSPSEVVVELTFMSAATPLLVFVDVPECLCLDVLLDLPEVSSEPNSAEEDAFYAAYMKSPAQAFRLTVLPWARKNDAWAAFWCGLKLPVVCKCDKRVCTCLEPKKK